MVQKPKVSLIILDYEKSRRVLENVASLQKQKVDFAFEIIVVDNSCKPEHQAKLKQLEKCANVQLILNSCNLGYPGGTNRGVAAASGEFLVLVNPDIVWREESALQKLVEFLSDNPQVGVAGPRQVNEMDESTAMTVRAFPRLWVQIARRTWLRHLPGIRQAVAYDEMRHLDYSQTQPVDWLQSSCVIIRRALWEQLHGLDERYFVFMSDPDFCWRAWAAGSEVIYFPAATVYADGLRASRGGFLAVFTSRALRLHIWDALKYRLRYFGRANPREKLAAQRKLGIYKLPKN
jgi:GT2 family glycosyltransferase